MEGCDGLILINQPDIDFTFNCQDYKNYLTYIKNKSGLYLIYNKEDELLYIGKAKNLYSRIISHLNGSSNLKDIYHNFYKVKMIFVNDPLYRELYETYMINTLKPLLNVEKVITYRSMRYEENYNPIVERQNKLMQIEIDKELENFVL